jgi:hypothetical protein
MVRLTSASGPCPFRTDHCPFKVGVAVLDADTSPPVTLFCAFVSGCTLTGRVAPALGDVQLVNRARRELDLLIAPAETPTLIFERGEQYVDPAATVTPSARTSPGVR